MNSALYEGRVHHRRRGEIAHEFRYDLFLVALDLQELETVFRGRWLWSARRPALAWFRRKDFHGPSDLPLDDAVRDTVQRELGRRPSGSITLFSNLRYYGLSFNPVSFYYVNDESGRLDTIVAEITNTPWLERHAYVLDARACGSGPLRFRFKKDFHVSPFLDMDYDYDWTFAHPGERMVVHMENRRDGTVMFDATLSLQRRPITGANLARTLVKHPFMTLKVLLAIYWQALRLRLKCVPFQVHPRKRLAPDWRA